MKYVAAFAVAAILAIGGGAYASSQQDGSDQRTSLQEIWTGQVFEGKYRCC